MLDIVPLYRVHYWLKKQKEIIEKAWSEMMPLNAHILDCHAEKSAFYVDMNMDVYNIR